MQQPQQQNQQRRYYQQRLRIGPVEYEEKARAINFAAEDDDQDANFRLKPRRVTTGGQPAGRLWSQQVKDSSERQSVSITSSRQFDVTDYDENDGRQRSRVKTRPVVGGRDKDVIASMYHHQSAERTPAQSRAPSVSDYTVAGSSYFNNNRQNYENPPPTTTAVQSPVAKRVAAGKQRKQKQGEQLNDTQWVRPRASSESSFGGRLFFGWRGAQYQAAAAKPPGDEGQAAAGESQQQPVQYSGKNLRNFSFTDAKIYSPQSYYYQQQQQQKASGQQPAKHSATNQIPLQQANRANIWSTMETKGAVKSVHSNQILLARGAP